MNNKTIEAEYIKIMDNAKLKFITDLLRQHLGKEPEESDYKKTSIGLNPFTEKQYISIDGISVGYILCNVIQENNSIKYVCEFVPE